MQISTLLIGGKILYSNKLAAEKKNANFQRMQRGHCFYIFNIYIFKLFLCLRSRYQLKC